ncbi:MFS general substrate transporter [Hysterangium stoloniferum]|nr:MFS general substrate transporter [Hysterangium stoloniferum]
MASTSSHPTERDPLLGSSSSPQPELPPPLVTVKKPWFRPRPLWLLPFAVVASLCRGMTLAPRTEVFVQLACENLWIDRHHSSHRHIDTISHLSSSRYPFGNTTASHFTLYTDIDSPVPSFLPVVLLGPTSPSTQVLDNVDDLPPVGDTPIDCTVDPAVQAGAAEMQTGAFGRFFVIIDKQLSSALVMITIMGILSALTTGWWGQFGDRHGRTKVLGAAVTGLLFTDVMFIIASNPPTIFQGRAHLLLIIAPIVEGLLGGWTTLQGAIHAYLSDCTSQGSRARIFSRFTGALYIGFAVGPEIAALILRRTHVTTFVFYVSAICAAINFFLVLFVFPESLNAEARARNIKAADELNVRARQDAADKTGLWRSTKFAVQTFISPLEVFAPVQRLHGRGKDWSLTLLAIAYFCFHLSTGLFQIKYLYAKHAFKWDAEMLSYYITTAGSIRALFLLFILPSLIAVVKPRFKPHLLRHARAPTANDSEESALVSTTVPNDDATDPPAPVAATPKKKLIPTPSALLREIKFDLIVAKSSILLDITSHTLVTLAASSSVTLFVGFSLITSIGTGLVPALHSVAMCTLNLRENSQGGKGGKDVGKLFGALSILQAVGSTILGPMLFGTIYSVTVGVYPKTIFVLAASQVIVALTMLVMIRPPRVDVPIEIRVDRQVEVQVKRTRGRGRSRGKKNIAVQ